jgi:cell division control protein 6
MDKQDLKKIISKLEQENSLFSNKASLDTLSHPTKISGRKKQAEELVRYLLGYRQGYVVPYVSVYGRSGSGKSSVVRFLCNNIDEIFCAFVNLRQAKTVFGAANLILGELGVENLKSAQGINLAIDTIGKEVESIVQKTRKKLFVLVLDELDVIFYDKRGKPSDFIYKLIVLEEKLRQKGLLLCIIGISNNVLSEYELDDRVKSRIGSSEIFFEPYSKSDVRVILQNRAQDAFSKKIDDKVLEHCSDLSSSEHGDARRAIDLLRVAAELVSSAGEELTVGHVDKASDILQKDRISQTLSSASYHLKLVLGGLARITYLTGEDWHSTSTVYTQYCIIIEHNTKPLTYRRVSELLNEVENTGLAVSQTSSRGRHGYGTQYKLTVSPQMVGSHVFPEWWQKVEKTKLERDHAENFKKSRPRTGLASNLSRTMDQLNDVTWKKFVGLD